MSVETMKSTRQPRELFCLVLLCALSLAALSLELWLVNANSGWAEMEASVPDEALFLEEAKVGFAHYGYGYGPVFWGTLTLILKITAPTSVLVTRSVFVIFKYAAFAIVTTSLWRYRKRFSATILLIALIGSPGFFFFWKIISPEYLLLLWTAFCADHLISDNGEIGRHYFISIVFASLATLTKLNALPLLCIIVGYGLFRSTYQAYNKKNPLVFRKICQIFGLLGIIVLSIAIVTWKRNLLDDIRLAFTLVPPFQWDLDVIYTAWNYEDVTWDQINLGGIAIDFAPTFFLGVLGVLPLLAMSAKSEGGPLWVLLASAAAILFSTVSHRMGHTWYLFLPMFLLSVMGANAIGQCRTSGQVTSLMIVAAFSIASCTRLQDRIDFKLVNNRELDHATAESIRLLDATTREFPCIKSANFDILLPVPFGRQAFLPLRLALLQWNNHTYSLPDLLLVNRRLNYKGKSPLLNLVIKENIASYSKISESEHVTVFVNKGLACQHGTNK